MTAYLSRNDYPSVDGSTADFAVSFPFLQRSDVHVYVAPINQSLSEVSVDAAWTWTSDSLIHFLSPPAAQSEVLVRRQTPDGDLLERLTAPSTITASEVNTIALQLLYLIQEALDAGASIDSDGLADLLNAIRWTYDVSLSGSNAFGTGQRIGPVPIVVEASYLPAGAVGSTGKGYGNTLSIDHVFGIRKNGATSLGTITVSHVDLSITWNVPADVTFTASDDLSLVTLTDGGLTNFGVTFRLRRIPA